MLKVALAMSGGVDSSVAAALLLRQGHGVLGLTMRLGNPGDDAAISDARAVARQLGIAHHVVDLREAFRREVKDDFRREYAAGRTPNPCVRCNARLKFGALWRSAQQQFGAGCFATGHYAAVRFNEATRRCELRRARDPGKDQSYVLYTLTQPMLSRLILPLGALAKPEVREIAAGLGLPVAHKSESQDICFLPDGDRQACLPPSALVPGEIVDANGTVLGRHGGVALYTIGQRRGLGIAAPEPLYVVALDAARHRVIVGTNEELFSRRLAVRGVNWIAGVAPTAPVKALVKIRYNHAGAVATVTPCPNDTAQVEFDEPQRAVAPGQSAVFYDGDVVLGGGVIAADTEALP